MENKPDLSRKINHFCRHCLFTLHTASDGSVRLFLSFGGFVLSQTKKTQGKKMPKPDYKWIILIFALTMVISGTMSFISSELLGRANLAVSFLILISIVLIGIIFDVIGVAVTSAEEKPFHSMASRKVPEAVEALRLIRNANRVSSFCNDVIGDICGVISGAASATIAVKVLSGKSANPFVELLLSALVAALTVGGKAFGKTFAIHMSTPIVQTTARILTFFRTLPEKLTKKKKAS